MASIQQRHRIAEEARYRCEYCLLQERISGIPLTLEHIIPRAHGGNDDDTNLWLSCRTCNEKKGTRTEAVDPVTEDLVLLFHPRLEQWADHFRWSADSTQIIGITSVGRATVVALDLNEELRMRARRIWTLAGWHPPE